MTISISILSTIILTLWVIYSSYNVATEYYKFHDTNATLFDNVHKTTKKFVNSSNDVHHRQKKSLIFVEKAIKRSQYFMQFQKWISQNRTRRIESLVGILLVNVIERLRQLSPCGIPEFDIPLLEPLYIGGKYEREIKVPGFWIKSLSTVRNISVENVTIRGLSKFEMNHVRFFLNNTTITVNMTVPTIFLDGYFTNRKSSWFDFIPAKGTLNSTLNNIHTLFQITLNFSNFMYVENFKSNFSITTVNLEISHLKISSNSANTYLEHIQTQLLPDLNNFLRDQLNIRIERTSIRNILDFYENLCEK